MYGIPRKCAAWWQAARFHFVPPSFLPAILGGVTAWATTGAFSPFYFALTVCGVTVNHISLNMTDDYFDYRGSIDRARDREKNPYSGGSGTLTGGLIRPVEMRRAFTAGYLVTIAIGVYLAVMRGWPVALFAGFGIGCAYFYTAPPLRYGYYGLGELSQLINFSVTIGLGSFFVQAQRLSWEAVCAVLPLGFMMFSMIMINEIPDERDDREGGKRTLVVRFGPRIAVLLYALSMCTAYAIIIGAPLAGAASYWMYLGLATLPLFLKGFAILRRNYGDPLKMSPANMITIRVHNLTGILLIIAYVIRRAVIRHGVRQMWIPLTVLAALYAPVALTVFWGVRSLRPAGGQR